MPVQAEAMDIHTRRRAISKKMFAKKRFEQHSEMVQELLGTKTMEEYEAILDKYEAEIEEAINVST